MNRRDFERMFLIRLAPVWFACRWKIMGHPLQGLDICFRPRV